MVQSSSSFEVFYIKLTTESHFYDPNFARQIRGKPTLEENVRLEVQHGRAVWLTSSHGEDSCADKLETPNRCEVKTGIGCLPTILTIL